MLGGHGERCLLSALCLWVVFLATPALAADEAEGELCIRNEVGATVAAWPMRQGQAFAIRYTHSVALTPVEDHFVIKGSVIHLDKTIYQDFGAGLPSAPEPGQSMSKSKGRIVISGYDRPLAAFDVRVGRVAEHTLLLPTESGLREMPLADLAAPGSALSFTYAPQGCGAGPSAHESFQRQP